MTQIGGSSYGRILKSCSLISGAQVIVFAVSFLKTKVAAVLIGPPGVGHQSLTAFAFSVSGLGLNMRGVREVAEASGSGNVDQAAKISKMLLCQCWLTGVAGTGQRAGLRAGGAAQSKALATMARRSSGLSAPQRERTLLSAT